MTFPVTSSAGERRTRMPGQMGRASSSSWGVRASGRRPWAEGREWQGWESQVGSGFPFSLCNPRAAAELWEGLVCWGLEAGAAFILQVGTGLRGEEPPLRAPCRGPDAHGSSVHTAHPSPIPVGQAAPDCPPLLAAPPVPSEERPAEQRQAQDWMQRFYPKPWAGLHPQTSFSLTTTSAPGAPHPLLPPHIPRGLRSTCPLPWDMSLSRLFPPIYIQDGYLHSGWHLPTSVPGFPRAHQVPLVQNTRVPPIPSVRVMSHCLSPSLLEAQKQCLAPPEDYYSLPGAGRTRPWLLEVTHLQGERPEHKPPQACVRTRGSQLSVHNRLSFR